MKNRVIVGMMLILLIGAFIGMAVEPAGASTMVMFEGQITTEPASQENPDIWNNCIVWQDNRNGNWDIYLYNDTTTAASRITTNAANQIKPKIYGDHIVYMDNRNNGNWDIYLYDLGTQTETSIANGIASQQNPAIYENRIVWQDNRNGEWDIYMYDLGNQTETQITRSSQFGGNWEPESRYQNPAIYGNRIVYRETKISENSCCPEEQVPVTGLDRCLLDTIYGIDLSNGLFPLLYITNDVQDQAHPAIYGDRVVWVGTKVVDTGVITDGQISYKKTPIPGVFMKNLVTISVWNSPGRTEQQNPDIYGNYIVWQGKKNRTPYDWDISIYNLDSQTETVVTNNTASQQNPSIYGNSIVYQDNRNGNWDIYLTKFGYVATLPGPGDNQTSDRGSLYIASSPSNATILINGTNHGTTNKFVDNVPSGNQNLTLIKDGYQPYTTIVNVPANDVKALVPITLTKGSGQIPPSGTGTIYVASYPSNATILINGTIYGTTDKFVYNVPSGSQNLTLIKDGYQPYTTIVSIQVSDMKVLAPITLTSTQPLDCTCPCMLCFTGTCICVA